MNRKTVYLVNGFVFSKLPTLCRYIIINMEELRWSWENDLAVVVGEALGGVEHSINLWLIQEAVSTINIQLSNQR